MPSSQKEWGILILRLGLSVVFLWFGFSQLFNGENWVSWVPEWAMNLSNLPPETIVFLNGAFEVVLGGLLAIGVWVRPVAILLTLHLAMIMFDIGMTAIGVRDFGLTLATFSLVFLSEKDA